MKLTITVQNGTLAGRRFDLSTGNLTVGRGANCNLVFDPNQENMVSTKHAHFEAQADGFYLFDDRSTNGTMVNGSQIQITKLNSGDIIQFGKNGPTALVQIEMDGVQPQMSNQFAPPPPPASTIQQNQFSDPFQNQAASFGQQSQPQFNADPFQQQNPNLRNSMSFIGLSNPAVKIEEKSSTGRYIGIAITLFALVFLTLIVIALITLSLSPSSRTGQLDIVTGLIVSVIAAIVAFTPAVIYIIPLMWLDRYDPEPPWLLALAFSWGALVAVIFSFVINTIIGSIFGGAVGAVISAPVFEEGSKGLGVIILLIFFRREFDDILDGIVYAGVIALGFATVENVLYYGRGFLGGGFGGLIILFVVRGIMSPFAHVTFTAMTGIGAGISRESHNMLVRIIMPFVGYCFAVALHATWNGMATFFGFEGFLLGYLILEIPFFLIFTGFSFYIMYRQNKILKEMLAIDVARGLISEEQMKTATSAFKSTGWLLGSIFSGKFGARRKFLRAVGKLGLSYWHIQRATAAQGHTGSFQQNPILRAEVEKWRDKV
ncbi:MAG: PrsW family intramembrane metalloprotease [Pyrinomonadaceae bacterium]|nr:PrsW family intramembrane metalloprotease [Pyrinomonadaceae bacterium]